VIALHSLRICRRYVSAGARRFCWRRSRWPNKAVLLTRELRARCNVVDSTVSLLSSALAARRVLWLSLDVIIRHVSLLFIIDLLVGWIGRYGDDVPCVEETREDTEHC
jgi:hypothetical protein